MGKDWEEERETLHIRIHDIKEKNLFSKKRKKTNNNLEKRRT